MPINSILREEGGLEGGVWKGKSKIERKRHIRSTEEERLVIAPTRGRYKIKGEVNGKNRSRGSRDSMRKSRSMSFLKKGRGRNLGGGSHEGKEEGKE